MFLKNFKKIKSNSNFQQLGLAFLIVSIWQLCLQLINQFVLPLINQNNLINKSPNIGILTNWFRWDSGWYYYIAKTGYHYVHTIKPIPQTVVFFPAFPLIDRVIHFLTGLSYAFSGLLINYLFTIGIIFIIIKIWPILIAKYSKNDSEYKLKNYYLPLILILSIPTIFVFSSFYSDATLVFFILLALYLAFKKKYLFAALSAGVASATIITGVVAVIGLVFIYIEQEEVFKLKPNDMIKEHLLKLIGLGLVGVWGLLYYMLYLQLRFKAFFSFYTDEKAWGRNGGSFLDNLKNIWIDNYAKIFDPKFFGSHATYLINITDMLAVLAILFIIIWSIKHKSLWLGVYSFVALILPISTGSISSMNRFFLILIPGVIFFLATLNKKFYNYLYFLLPILFISEIILMVYFLSNIYVF